MTLVHHLLAVELAHERAVAEACRPRAEPHRAALLDDVALIVHQVDDGIRRVRIELTRVRTRESAHVARVLDDRAVQTEAQTEEGHALLAGVGDRGDLALDTAHAEATGHDDAV